MNLGGLIARYQFFDIFFLTVRLLLHIVSMAYAIGQLYVRARRVPGHEMKYAIVVKGFANLCKVFADCCLNLYGPSIAFIYIFLYFRFLRYSLRISKNTNRKITTHQKRCKKQTKIGMRLALRSYEKCCKRLPQTLSGKPNRLKMCAS